MYSKLTRNAILSVVQTAISGIMLFLLYRYLIKLLGTPQLGLWSVILASTSVARLSDMGLTGSVVKFVAKYRALKDDYKAAEVVQTASISIGLVMGVLAFAIYPLLDDLLTLAIPPASMPVALSILPWAVFTLWLGSVAGVLQSGLDGCQRMDLRNLLMIIGNTLFFVAAVWLVPRHGLIGLAVGQAAQGLFLLVSSWFALRRQLTALPWFPRKWSITKFREMFSYAINFQINSVAILFFEPITKLFMSRYGGLSSAGYYEMASQLVVKLRSLLIAANQVLVPAFAELNETSPQVIKELYLKVYRMLFFIVVPYYATIVIILPLVSLLLIGHFELNFLQFGLILAIGWGLNSLISPAYFLNLGTGDLHWNTVAHVLMAVLNIILGLLLGYFYGGLGVVIGSMSSMVIASAIIILVMQKKYSIPLRNIIPSEHLTLVFMVFIVVCISIFVNVTNFIDQNNLGLCVMSLLAYTLIIGIVIWFHPYRTLLLERLRTKNLNTGT